MRSNVTGERRPRGLAALALVALLAACGGSGSGDADGGSATAAASGGSAAGASAAGLTEEQMEHGIGPVSVVELGPIDATLADRGGEVFQMKCSACHRLDERYVGPPLGDVLERREPEYVMNMILNPQEMVQKHPTAKKLLGEYFTPMPNQGLTREEARAVLEYLRRAGSTADHDADDDHEAGE